MLPATITTVEEPDLPASSVTVSCAVYCPAAVYVCVGFGSVDVGVPSPKSHRYVSASPSGSLEPVAENCTVSAGWPESLSALAFAFGVRLPLAYSIRYRPESGLMPAPA